MYDNETVRAISARHRVVDTTIVQPGDERIQAGETRDMVGLMSRLILPRVVEPVRARRLHRQVVAEACAAALAAAVQRCRRVRRPMVRRSLEAGLRRRRTPCRQVILC